MKELVTKKFKSFMTLVCCANHWTGFYMIGTSVMKELIGSEILVS